jgi:ADP-heptose:LPS heptosyltransferase
MKKILVLRFSSIGDIVLTSPVVRALKKQLACEVHFLTKSSFRGIVAHNPYIDKVFTFEKDIHEVTNELKAEQYDFVVDLHHNLRTLRLKRLLKRPSTSFPKLNIRKYFYVRFKWSVMPDVHIVDRYFEAVKSLGVHNDELGLDYFIPQEEEVDTTNFLSDSFQTGYVAIALGAQFATKRLPFEKLHELISGITLPVVLLGGKEDAETGAKLSEIDPTRVYNAAGRCSLNQSASLVKQAVCLITHDTGLMHIGSAFKKDVFSIWGNTTPQLGMYPYLPGKNSQQFEVENLSCRPCSKIGHQQCPKGHFKCMTEQDVTKIIRAVHKKSPEIYPEAH